MKIYILFIQYFLLLINIAVAQAPIVDTVIDVNNYPEISFNFSYISELGNWKDTTRLVVKDSRNKTLITKNDIVTPFDQITINYFMSSPDLLLVNKSKKDKEEFLQIAGQNAQNSNLKIEQYFYSIDNDSLNPRLLFLPTDNKGIDSLNCNSSIPQFKRYYSRSSKLFTNRDILVFQIRDSNFELLQDIIAGFFENKNSNQKLVMIIYDKISIQKDQIITTSLDPPLIIISKEYFDKNVKAHFMSFISPWLKRSYKTKFIDSEEFSLIENRSYNLEIALGDNKFTQKIPVQINKPLIMKRYKDASSNEAEILVRANRYIESLKKLKSRSDTFNNKVIKDSIYFNKIAREKIIQYGNYLCALKDDSSLFRFRQAEKIWGISRNKEYVKEKEKVFSRFLNNIENIEGKEDERFLIAESLKEFNPSEENKFKFYASKGDIFSKKKEFWQAANSYQKAIETSKIANQKIANLRSKVVVEAVNQSFSKNNFQELYQNGLNYLSDIYSNFTSRLYYAIACKETNHFPEAFNEFDWLVKNWQKQGVMSWDDAMKSLSLLSSTSDYNRSLSISKQIFLDSKTTNNGFQKDGLLLYLLNARAKFYQPLIEIIPIAASSLKAFTLKNLNPPDELTYMGIVDKSLNEVNVFISKEKLIKSKTLSAAMSNDKSFFVYERDGSYGWLVSKVDNSRYFVIQINNKLNNAIEKTTLEKIFYNPLSGENWDELYAYEEGKGFHFLAKSITAFVEIGFSSNKNVIDFWNVLKKHDDYIKYMIFHEKGKSEIKFGKCFILSDYPQNDWQRSSQTVALYDIIISKGNKVYNDISNPILVKGKVSCVLRIGLEKKE